MKLTIYGDPRTKKNSSRIVMHGKRPILLPSKAYTEYERMCIAQVKRPKQPLSGAYNVQMVFYMKTRRKVDLVGLEQGCLDMLVSAGVLLDDNCKIAASYDGSRVEYDRNCPRVEITITEVTDGMR